LEEAKLKLISAQFRAAMQAPEDPKRKMQDITHRFQKQKPRMTRKNRKD
jgi:hypothetical protein